MFDDHFNFWPLFYTTDEDGIDAIETAPHAKKSARELQSDKTLECIDTVKSVRILKL